MSGTAHHNCPPSRPAPPRASAAAARGRGLVAAGLALLAVAAGPPAVAQQLGDFGRLQPGFVNDELVPLVDRNRRGMNGRPLDGFNLTDEEVEMRDRVWRFLVAPHAKDWAWPYGAEIRQAKAGSLTEQQVGMYYRWLTSQRYASSRVRYNTITDHVAADIGTLPPTFRSICAVLELDRQRAVAVAETGYVGPEMVARQQQRDRENGAFIERFVLALGFRYDSYQYALDHFLVETPHREAVEVDAALGELAIWVERANEHDFCGDAWSAHAGGEAALPGRLLLAPPDEGPYRK
jgi:hypothetical protein